MERVQYLEINSEKEILPGQFVTAYYAGHVLGAVVYYIRTSSISLMYTGDYNTTPDRHIGCARVPRQNPDIQISESTYATVIRDSKKFREQEFLLHVKEAIDVGGKVQIPVFALGRAQEQCMLLDTFWERVGFSGRIPIYLAGNLSTTSTKYYKMYIEWTSEYIKNTLYDSNNSYNCFTFSSIQPFSKTLLDDGIVENDLPMVIFATPGMLHTGQSLEIFRRWCNNEKNLIVIPGFCVPGTVGAKLLRGERIITLEKEYPLERYTCNVKCRIENLSFSAHADSFGIINFIRQIEPKNVLLVHGTVPNMIQLSQNIYNDIGIPTYCPKIKQNVILYDDIVTNNNDTTSIDDIILYNTSESDIQNTYKVNIAQKIINEWRYWTINKLCNINLSTVSTHPIENNVQIECYIAKKKTIDNDTNDKSEDIKQLLEPKDILAELNLKPLQLRCKKSMSQSIETIFLQLSKYCKNRPNELEKNIQNITNDTIYIQIQSIQLLLETLFVCKIININNIELYIEGTSILLKQFTMEEDKNISKKLLHFIIVWEYDDDLIIKQFEKVLL